MTQGPPPVLDDPAGSYVKALEATRHFVAGIRSDQWDSPTPCIEWTLRQLLHHVVWGTVWIEDMFAGKTIQEVGDRFAGDLLGRDPLAAYDAAVASAKKGPGGAWRHGASLPP